MLTTDDTLRATPADQLAARHNIADARLRLLTARRDARKAQRAYEDMQDKTRKDLMVARGEWTAARRAVVYAQDGLKDATLTFRQIFGRRWPL